MAIDPGYTRKKTEEYLYAGTKSEPAVSAHEIYYGSIPAHPVIPSGLRTITSITSEEAGATSFPPPIGTKPDKNLIYLPVLERIAKSLEAIVERFC
jgi:hypothetical protein